MAKRQKPERILKAEFDTAMMQEFLKAGSLRSQCDPKAVITPN
jgi:hypothetical protein